MTINKADIEEKSKGPARVTTDEGSVRERTIDELIKADKYNKAQEIGDAPLHGLRISRCKPGGPV